MHVITRITNGGSERRLLDALTVPAHHVVVAGEQHSGPNLDAILQSASVTTLKSLRRAISPWNDMKTVVSLRSRILSDSVDILHSHQSKAGLLSRIALSLIPRNRRPLLIHSLSMASFGAGYGKVQSSVFRTLEKLTHHWVDEYLVVGDDLAETYRNIGVPDEKLKCVRSSLDLQAFSKTSHLRNFSNRPVKLLFVGSLDRRKGVFLIPELVRTISHRAPVELLVAGAGPLTSELQKEIDDHALPIKLLGYRRDVAELMTAADLLLLPSFVEGLPQVLVQAVANKLPFISFDIHGARELIKLGGDGTICEESTVPSMASAFFERMDRGQVINTQTLPTYQWTLTGISDQIFHSYQSAGNSRTSIEHQIN